jgi:hypothetical protein
VLRIKSDGSHLYNSLYFQPGVFVNSLHESLVSHSRSGKLYPNGRRQIADVHGDSARSPGG